ncbi:MAG TPA: 2-oxoglutarate dehydrogenase complex dihydrolipoyllysine-residue succinyltransferase [Stellaceae bacterium]|nr:2-oxoglutarate dehydrogenase complex dihydrolipoyllysine-residue succinyltransferase [Stellaceae bacterium]
MAIDIKVPALGESVTEASVGRWLKKAGDSVNMDDPLVEIETDKVTLEVNAPAAGMLAEIVAEEGATVNVGAILGHIAEGKAAAAKPAAAPKAVAAPQAAPAPKATRDPLDRAGPAARKLVADKGVDPAAIAATGPGGRITKGDVLAASAAPAPAPVVVPLAKPSPPAAPRPAAPREQRVRMTRLRRTIAERLKEAQNTAAMLTTFNEVDMTAAMALRDKYREPFEKKYGVRLGYMSIFIKACIEALKDVPAVNAEFSGDDLIYKNHYDIGVAVGTEQGLVVPVVRDADAMSFADIEKKIGDLARRARDGKLSLDELQGGTFTITNGGIYGSLMSTPILNPPQSGILGMHKIMKRPMVIGDKIEARPMMYLALSYDHRVIDGREAVTFLVRVKECVEDPERLLFEV